MKIDEEALENLRSGNDSLVTLRFFQWKERTASFGYLIPFDLVKKWSDSLGGFPLVKRPTGGGVVIHKTTDLSFSLLWPRSFNRLSHHPRVCYEEIHSLVKKGVENFLGSELFHLHTKQTEQSCETRELGQNKGEVSMCFNEPVCNDVMLGNQKVVGGALRVTKEALLYQGHIQLPLGFDFHAIKTGIQESVMGFLNPELKEKSTEPLFVLN